MIKSETESIEAFMGSLVHSTLEKLYKDLLEGIINSKEEIVRFYLEEWAKKWHKGIVIAKEGFEREYYQNLGLMFLLEYYDKYHPFNQLKTIEVETDEKLELSNNNKYYVKIDRLAKDEKNNYYVIDYKTGNAIKSQNDLDNDRQLAMYSVWVKEKHPEARNVILMWNFLAFNEEKTSQRTNEELEKIKKEVENKIKEIEICNEFPANVTRLCDYCEYKPMCPAWRNKQSNKIRYYKQRLMEEY